MGNEGHGGGQDSGKTDSTERRLELIRQELKTHGSAFSLRNLIVAIRQEGLWPVPTPQEVDAVVSMYADCIVINEVSDCQKELSIERKESNDFSVESYVRRLVDLTFGWDDPPRREEEEDDEDQNG